MLRRDRNILASILVEAIAQVKRKDVDVVCEKICLFEKLIEERPFSKFGSDLNPRQELLMLQHIRHARQHFENDDIDSVRSDLENALNALLKKTFQLVNRQPTRIREPFAFIEP